CRDRCRTWVSATGLITRDTPADFAALARQHDLRGALLVLDSSGGAVLGTLALGREIRRLGMTATVGKTQKLAEDGADRGRATLSPRADCESMCAFLLLAGKQRFVPPEAQVLVHEIWLGDRRDDAAAATYSAEDIVVLQRDIGRLAQYTVEMGGSIDLLEIALRIPPWEPMRKLSAADLRRVGLDTRADVLDSGSQAMAVAVSAASPPMPRVSPVAGGWSVSEKSGRSILNRSHPLTLEGDEIGSFDLVFSCAAAPDSYDVAYFEKRRGAGAQPGGDALKRVAIYVGRKSVSLNVVGSQVRPEDRELESVARGVVPADFLELLARDGSRSLTVKTAASNDVETAIRIGNTGAAQNLPRLAASCREQSAAHAELQPAQAVEAAGQPK
ncbi:MAG: hypothetical protein WEC82_05145, partial [Xanthobacteraceae bacterium]